MKLSFQMVVWLIICGLCASLATGVCRADNVESVINNITAARNKIDSYHLKIVVPVHIPSLAPLSRLW